MALAYPYRVAPLGSKSAAQLQTVFGNIRYRFFAWVDGRLAAVGRAWADGTDRSYIGEVAGLPEGQGSV